MPTTSNEPLFRRIAGHLTDAIFRGTYPVGSKLPTEAVLARRFNASRFTVREALDEIRRAGMIASRRGSGTVVVRDTPLVPSFGEGYRSVDDFLASVAEAPLVPLEIHDVVADPALAAELRCAEGRQFLLLRGIRRRRGRPGDPPMALVDAYIGAPYSEIRFPQHQPLTESIAGTAEKRFGVRVVRIVQEMEPVLLTSQEGAALIADPALPALRVRRWYFLEDGEALLISRSVYPQGRLVHRTELFRGHRTLAAPNGLETVELP